MNNKQETIKERLAREGFTKKQKHSNKKNKAKKSKKFVVVVTALITAVAIAIGSGIGVLIYRLTNKNKNNNKKNESSISTLEIGDIGTELEFAKENTTSKYGKTTGKVDINKIVEKNGKIYVDKESADKSNKVGTSSIDTKGDTLKVESNGTVKEKTEGYEIKDKETGSTIQSGNVNSDGTIDGFKKDEDLDGIFEEKDDVETLVYADANYYDQYGNLALQKGDLVEEERLEYAKKYYSTTKPVQSSTSSTTSSNVSNTTSSTTNQGIINPDETYTIFGLTFESKADYEQWVLQGYEGYAEVDGIMKSESEIQKQIQKVK